MKKITTLLLFIACSSFAQNTEKLNPVAALLFKNVKTKLTIAEQNNIATQTGFVLSGNKDQPFAQDKDSKDYPFNAVVSPTDLNKDGKEEIFIGFGNSYTSGAAGMSVMAYIKNSKGIYEMNLGFPGMVDVLSTSNQGYPDLLIGGPGFEYPVWRWNGKAYDMHKTVKDADYEKLKPKNIEEVSKTYQQNLP